MRRVEAVIEAARVTPSGTLVVFENEVKHVRVRQREKRARSVGPKRPVVRRRAPNSRPTGAKPGAKKARPGTKRPRHLAKKKTEEQKRAAAAAAALSDDGTEDEEEDVPEEVKERLVAAAGTVCNGGGGGGGGGDADVDSEAELEECDDEQSEIITESRQRRFAPRVGRSRIALAAIPPERVATCRRVTAPPLAADLMSYVTEVFLFLDEACRLASTCVGYHRVARDFMHRMVWCCMPVVDRMCVGANKCKHNFARPSGEVLRLPEFVDRPKLVSLLAAIRAGERPPADGANVCGCKSRPFVPIFDLESDNAWRFVPSNDTYRCTCLTQQPHGLAPPDPRHSVYCYSIPEETQYVRLTPAQATDHQRFLHILALLRRNMAEHGPLTSRASFSPPSLSPASRPTRASLLSSLSLASASSPLGAAHADAASANAVQRVLRRARKCNVVASRIIMCPSFDAWLRRVNLAHNVFSSCWMSADGAWFQPVAAQRTK